MVDRDFEYIKDLLNDFFAIKTIRDKLNLLEEYGITGWETWMQVEFAAFLSHLDGEWEREGKYPLDQRRSVKRTHFKPDFVLRKKGWEIGSYVVLEFKQNNQPAACIRNMVIDLEKVAKFRQSAIRIRSAWSIGVTPLWDVHQDALVDLAKQYINPTYSSTKSLAKHLYAKPIKKTNYGFILI